MSNFGQWKEHICLMVKPFEIFSYIQFKSFKLSYIRNGMKGQEHVLLNKTFKENGTRDERMSERMIKRWETCTFPDCICCHQRFGTWIKIGIIFQVFFKRNNFFFLKKIKQVELSPFKKILYFQVFVSPFVTCKVCSRCVYDATVTNIIVLLRCSHGDDDHHHILCTI